MPNVSRKDWLEPVARVGFATKGIVYVLIGLLAAMAAFGEGGKVSGGKGAMATIGSQPFGKVLLYIVGAGLIGYAIWRFMEAAFESQKEMWKRGAYAVSGIIHVGLAIAAFQMATAGGSSGQESSKKTYLAEVLTWPGGKVIIILAGIAVVGAGLYQLYKSYTAKFTEKLKLNEMSAEERTWAIRVGRAGLAARGVVFPIIGYFIIKAGWTADPSDVKGVGGALREIGSSSYGQILLAAVAIGLGLYGTLQLVNARYRRVAV